MAFLVRGVGRRGGMLGLAGVKRKGEDGDDVIDLRDAARHEELILLDERDNGRMSMQKKREKICEAGKICEQYLDKFSVPGLSVAISVRGRLIFRRGFGFQDVENGVVATGDMLGDVGGVSKLFSAHLLMKFHDSSTCGFKYWHDVKRYVPQLNRNLTVEMRLPMVDGKMITVKRKYPQSEHLYASWLLCHRSGIRHFECYSKECEDARARNFSSAHEAMDMYIRSSLVQWPGLVKYSSYAVNLAGVLVECLAKMSFVECMNQNLQDLDLNYTFLHHMDEEYFHYSRGYKCMCTPATTRDKRFVHPSGGVVANVTDLVKFGNIYLSMFKDLERGPLKSSTVQHMWSQHAIYPQGAFGIGWDISAKDIGPNPNLKLDNDDDKDEWDGGENDSVRRYGGGEVIRDGRRTRARVDVDLDWVDADVQCEMAEERECLAEEEDDECELSCEDDVYPDDPDDDGEDGIRLPRRPCQPYRPLPSRKITSTRDAPTCGLPAFEILPREAERPCLSDAPVLMHPSFEERRLHRVKISHGGSSEGFSAHLAVVFDDARDLSRARMIRYGTRQDEEYHQLLTPVRFTYDGPDSEEDEPAPTFRPSEPSLPHNTEADVLRLQQRCHHDPITQGCDLPAERMPGIVVAVIANRGHGARADALVDKLVETFVDF